MAHYRIPASSLPSSFLNPLPPEGRDRAPKARQPGVLEAAAAGARAGAATANTLTGGLLSPLGDPLGFLGLPGDIKKTGEEVNKLATKALIGEVVLVAGVLGVIGIAAWFFSKSPENRDKVWSVGSHGAKYLLTKG